MEEMLWRFPHIGQEIYQQLNDQSLSECREISQSWQNFINNEKFYKKRIKEMIEKHTKAYNDESVHYYCGGSTKETLTPLHSAALTGQFQMFINIIQEDLVEDINVKNERGVTPLHLAALKGQFSICKYIIEEIAEINPRDWLGNTPLHKAATEGHLAICEMIIDNLTNKNPEDFNGRITPLHNWIKTIILYDKNPEDFNGITPLHWAAHYGHLSICQLIMRNCDEKNPKGHMGDTPFYFAARMGHVKICKFFIENIPIDELMIQNSFDDTPLDIAERMIQHLEVSQPDESTDYPAICDYFLIVDMIDKKLHKIH